MAFLDKAGLERFWSNQKTYQQEHYTHPTYTPRTGKPTGNQTPGFGQTFTVSQIKSDATGHVTGATDRTVKIPALPTASGSTLGVVKVNSDDMIVNSESAPIKINSNGEIYTLVPVGSADNLGIVSLGDGFEKDTFELNGTVAEVEGSYHVAKLRAATASAAGAAGIAPQPKAGDQAKFLRGDATWQPVITAHRTYTAFTGKPTANATPGFGDTFTIQQISQSTTGQVSGTDRTIKIPVLPTASTSVAGIVQLSDATNSTSTTLAGTANAVKKAYDLANGAIPKSIGTAAGDIIYWSSSGTPARLAKGSNGQVLKINSSGVPAWATDNNDNNHVNQANTTTPDWRKMLLHYSHETSPTASVTDSTNVVYATANISAQPSTGTIRANAYNVKDQVTLQYNSTDASLDFVFA